LPSLWALARRSCPFALANFTGHDKEWGHLSNDSTTTIKRQGSGTGGIWSLVRLFEVSLEEFESQARIRGITVWLNFVKVKSLKMLVTF
jgi:hypothetical protein